MQRKAKRTRRGFYCLVLAAAAGLAARQSLGATETWTGLSGNWATAASWNAGAGPVPGSGDTVDIENADATNRVITYNYAGSPITLSSLTIDNTGGGGDMLLMTAGDALDSNLEYVGNSGAGNDGIGVVTQSNGTNTVNSDMYLGLNATDNGTYNLSGTGAVSGSGGQYIGYRGTGNFNQTGGSNSTSQLNVGVLAGSNGTYTLSGGSLTVTGLGLIGSSGTGTFTQTGGTNTLTGGTGLFLGDGTGNTGTYNLSGANGSLTVTENEYVGETSPGIFNQTGGTNTIESSFNLYLGYTSTATGTYTISNGTLTVDSGNVYVGGTSSAAGGKGNLTVTNGGALNMSNTAVLTVYNTTGSGLTLNGGTISTGSLNLSGNTSLFNWTSGELTLNNEAVVIDSTAAANFGDSEGGSGSLTLAASQILQNSGNLTVGYNGTGTLSEAGGTAIGSNTVGGDVYIGYNSGSTGAVTLNGFGVLAVTGNMWVGGNNLAAGGKGNLTITGASSLTVIGTGTLSAPTGTLTVYNTTGSGLTLSGGTINTGSLNLSGNTSLFNWTGGTLNLTNESVTIDNTSAANFGDSEGGSGSVPISPAQGLTVSGYEYVGYNGTGSISQSGGTNALTGVTTGTGALILGWNPGSTGTYTLSGSGALVANSLNGGEEIVGYSGTGNFNQTGGTNTFGNAADSSSSVLVVGYNFGSRGTYTLSNGTVAFVGIEAVGAFGTGTFTQTGGTNVITAGGGRDELDLGFYGGGSGTYTLSGGSLSVGAQVNVGGSIYYGAGGTGVLSVSGTGVLSAVGALTIFNTPGTSVTLGGGTINAGGLDFNGLPSLFNWTSGTLNLTSNVTWDSGAANTTTSDAFGNSLAIGSNQTLMVTGNETIGGVGAFSLTLNSGGTHYVTGGITLNPSGVLTANAGSTLYYSTFTQAGGTFNGTLQNQGGFTYQSGAFNGRLVNQGYVSFGPSFTAGNGIENDTNIYVSAGQTLTVNGAGLDNLGFFNLGGGVISGSGSVVNDYSGTMQAYGTINPALTNDGTLTVNGVLRLASTIANIGIVQGQGDVIGNFSNTSGGSVNVSNSSLEITSAWSNSSIVNLQASGAVLGGGTITNTGTIQGVGTVNSPVTNSTGVIRASGGTLQLGGSGDTNASGAQIQTGTGATVFYTQGLTTNAGMIALAGGTFDNNNRAITNTGYISGSGIFRSGGLTNNGFLYIGGNTQIYGAVTNGASGAINATGTGLNAFYGPVTNTAGGSFGVQSGASVTFFNSFTGTSPVPNFGTVTMATLSSSGAITGTGQTFVGDGSDATLKLVANSGTSAQSAVTISSGSTLDITNNILDINYGAGADPIATVRSELAGGYNNGAWNGTGIVSTTAQTDPGHGIGYSDNCATVELKYTLYGDANLDGTVNFNDLLALAANYTSTNADWAEGDFNYDGTVNFSDLLLLAQNYTATLSTDPAEGVSSSFAADWALAQAEVAMVPEPAALGLLMVGAAGLLGRRRRVGAK